MRPRRIIALVFGSLIAIPAIAVLIGGAALGLGYAFARGDDGYFDATLDRLESETVAIVAEDIAFAAEPGSPDWLIDTLDADVRLRVDGADTAEALFIGIGPEDDVARYLSGVAHDELIDVDEDLEPEYRTFDGVDTVAPPGQQTFWTASASGLGEQQLDWEFTSGRWSAVVMNADASPGIGADVNVGVKAGFVLPLALILLGVGAVGTALAVTLIVFGASGGSQSPPDEPAPEATDGLAATPGRVIVADHPVTLTARLDPDLSRWQWLVKWFLAIPHFIVLFFLWLAFVVLTVLAGFSILFTTRYPRGIFDFNVGVLRWTWRVSFYATTGGVGTDRYPPFTLHEQPDDPARLDVAHPTELSRGLVLVKWWLLAIPHYLVLGVLLGSIRWFGFDGSPFGFDPTGGGGVLGLLVLVAAGVLAFTGRYPQPLFDLIVGFNRWIYRVIAYAALMTDTYPPFRLDQGGSEPMSGSDPPGRPPAVPGQVDLRDAAPRAQAGEPVDA